MYAKIHYHIGQYLANNLVDFFLNNNIIIIDYRAQSHAKSSNILLHICLEYSIK